MGISVEAEFRAVWPAAAAKSTRKPLLEPLGAYVLDVACRIDIV